MHQTHISGNAFKVTYLETLWGPALKDLCSIMLPLYVPWKVSIWQCVMLQSTLDVAPLKPFALCAWMDAAERAGEGPSERASDRRSEGASERANQGASGRANASARERASERSSERGYNVTLVPRNRDFSVARSWPSRRWHRTLSMPKVLNNLGIKKQDCIAFAFQNL